MIDIKCETPDTLKLADMKPFQGNLKKRTINNIKQLAESIKNDGLLMPFAIWHTEGVNYLLDGHGRLDALYELLVTDPDVAEQEFPVLYIHALTEQEARQSLLQITSSYGHITKEGALKFCASIPEYKAPSINKYVHKKPRRHEEKVKDSFTRIHISVKTEYVDKVLELFKQFEYIRVLK